MESYRHVMTGFSSTHSSKFGHQIEIGDYPKCVPSYSWIHIPPSPDPLPCEAVLGGELETGQISYIGKGRVEDQEPCGFFTDEDRQLHVAYGCEEHVLKDFDVLVVQDQNALIWQECAGGHPPTANVHIPVSVDITGLDYSWGYMEKMIVGRTCTPLSNGQTFDGIRLQLSRFASTEQETCR